MDVQTFSAVMGGTLPLSRYQALLPAWNQALIQANCTTVNRVAMWCAQVGHESVGLKYMSEIWGPTPTQLTYEGRVGLGNNQPGDGKRFMGHGPIQITGRGNHLAVSRWAFANGYVPTATYFIDHPAELGADRYGFLGVVWYWTVARRMNGYADSGGILGATKAVNGGTNGLTDRTTRWKRALAFGTRLLPTQEDDDMFTDADRKVLLENNRILRDIWQQLAGPGAEPGGFTGWPPNANGSGAPRTLVDYGRQTDVQLEALKASVAGLAARQV